MIYLALAAGIIIYLIMIYNDPLRLESSLICRICVSIFTIAYLTAIIYFALNIIKAVYVINFIM